MRADTVLGVGASKTASPLDPVYATLAIENATDRDEIVELVLRGMRSETRLAALLTVHADSLRGDRAIADPRFDAAKVESLSLLRNTVPAFEQAITSGQPVVGSIATGDSFVDGVLELLGGRAMSAVVLPLVIEGKTFALAIGHRDNVPVTENDVSDVLRLGEIGSHAIERLRQVRKRAATVPRNDTSVEIEVIFHPAEKLSELRSIEAWPELADAIRSHVMAGVETGDPGEDEQLELLLELGHLEADRLKSVDRALDAWRSALAIDARDERVLEALHQTLTKHARWRECAELLERRVALTEDVSRRVELLLELATIARRQLADDDTALAAFLRVLDHVPDHADATSELEALYERTGQWEAMAALLLDRAGLREDVTERVAALERVARMYEDKANDKRAAFLVWTAALRCTPESPDIVDHIVRLGPLAGADAITEGSALAEEIESEHPTQAARIWQLVGALASAGLREEQRWTELAELLEARIEHESDPDRLYALCIELGTLREGNAESLTEAIAAFERALSIEPESVDALVALHRLYRRSEAWTELAELLPRLIAVTEGPRSALVEIWVELGAVLGDRLQRHDEAIEAFATARQLAPTHRGALQGSARMYEATGRTEELLEAREATVDASTGTDRAASYAEIANAWEDRGRPDRAARCRRKQLLLTPLDVAAHDGLVRALRLNEEWSALADAIAAFVPVAPKGDRLQLLLELADIRDVRQGDVDGAIGAYKQVLALDPQQAVAQERLSDLYERAGQSAAAIELLTRQLAAATSPRTRADLLQRLGHVYVSVQDFERGRDHIAQALSIDPSNAGALESMAWLHVNDGALASAGDSLVRSAQSSDHREDRLRRYLDAAWLYWHRMRDAERARSCLHSVLKLEPDHPDATHALAELLADQREWETLWPRLEQEVARSGDDADLLTRAARCALELDKFDKARELFDRAFEIAPSAALAIERADALFTARAFEDAVTAYQAALLVEGVDNPLRVRVHRRLAEVFTQLGRLVSARRHHQDVLALEPTHADTLADLVELELGRGLFDEAIVHLRVLASSGATDQRVGYLERIGDIYRERLHNPTRAISTYVEGLELTRGNRRLLQRILDVQTETGQWRAAVDTIGQFIAHETDAARRASYHLAAAEIRRGELKDKPGALVAYEQALDDLFLEQPPPDTSRKRGLDTFVVIDKLMVADRDWRGLEQAYVRMIKRLPKTDPALVALWHALGELYRLHIGNDEHALAAFEVAQSLDPTASTMRARILDELRHKLAPPAPTPPAPPPPAPAPPTPPPAAPAPTPPPAAAPAPTPPPARPPARPAPLRADTPVSVRFDTPVPIPRGTSTVAPLTPIPTRAATNTPIPRRYERAVSRVSDPNLPASYREIGRRSIAAGQLDEAWCIARTLVLLRQASPEERELYMHYRPLETREATATFDEDTWSFVRHANEDRAISAIFAQIWQSAAQHTASNDELKPKERVHVEDGGRLIARICRYAARVLDVALPEVYVQPHRAGRVALVHRVERGRLLPTIVVGRDLLAGYRPPEVTSSLAATITQLRPAYHLNLALTTETELEAALGAAALLVGRSDIGATPLRAKIAADLQQRLLGPQLSALRTLVARLPERPDLGRWRRAVDATAQRAALLVSGELVAVARMIATDPAVTDSELAGRRVEELIAFSVTPKYFAARTQLGVTVA